MRQRRVWRYYCEFCKKSGCHSGHIRTHEAHCVRNPNRKCRLCAKMGTLQAPTHALAHAATLGLEELRRAADGCVVCMLVGAVNQSDGTAYVEGFNYDAEKSEMWRQYDEERQAAEYARGGFY
jgi:formylmethanofuran dehydrogenase subunit E-like metal-binding protein